MKAQVIPLAFDSEVFGLSCGRIELGDAPPDRGILDGLLSEARELDLRHLVVRMPSRWVAASGALEERGFRFMVCSLELSKHLDGAARPDDAVRPYEGGEDARLAEITAGAFADHTRFHFEPRFAPAAVHEFYQRWIRNLIVDPTAQILVHWDRGTITGYATVTCQEHAGHGHIGLLAVDTASWGRGIAGRLLRTLESGPVGRFDTLGAMTESINTGALAAYGRAGFAIRRSWTVLHGYLGRDSNGRTG